MRTSDGKNTRTSSARLPHRECLSCAPRCQAANEEDAVEESHAIKQRSVTRVTCRGDRKPVRVLVCSGGLGPDQASITGSGLLAQNADAPAAHTSASCGVSTVAVARERKGDCAVWSLGRHALLEALSVTDLIDCHVWFMSAYTLSGRCGRINDETHPLLVPRQDPTSAGRGLA
jgi:hypothetical protein